MDTCSCPHMATYGERVPASSFGSDSPAAEFLPADTADQNGEPLLLVARVQLLSGRLPIRETIWKRWIRFPGEPENCGAFFRAPLFPTCSVTRE